MGTNHDGTYHACDGIPEETDGGWWLAACTCGTRSPDLPDLETAIDWLMDHAGAAMERVYVR